MRLRTMVGTVGVGMVSTVGVTALPGSAAVAAASGSAVRVPVSTGVCQPAKARPGVIRLAVDGSSFLDGYIAPGSMPYSGDNARLPGLVWTAWTASGASTTGSEWIDDDTPSVGTGTDYAFRATIRLFRPRRGVFTRMTITADVSSSFDRKYFTVPPRETLQAEACSHGGYSWS